MRGVRYIDLLSALLYWNTRIMKDFGSPVLSAITQASGVIVFNLMSLGTLIELYFNEEIFFTSITYWYLVLGLVWGIQYLIFYHDKAKRMEVLNNKVNRSKRVFFVFFVVATFVLTFILLSFRREMFL